VFTARYALSPYIKQIRFVFKGLSMPSATWCAGSDHFWNITQHRVVTMCRRFGTTYWYHFKDQEVEALLWGCYVASSGSPLPTSNLDFLTLEDGTDTLSPNVGKGLPLLDLLTVEYGTDTLSRNVGKRIAIGRRVISQKNADIIIAAETEITQGEITSREPLKPKLSVAALCCSSP
jgi:hypothetical protein